MNTDNTGILGNTIINTDKGCTKIQDLYKLKLNNEKLPKILSYNIENNIYEYKPIVSITRYDNSETLIIKTNAGNSITCTGNCEIFTSNEYIEAEMLILNKDYTFLSNYISKDAINILNDDQYNFILGSYLGYGYLERKDNTNIFSMIFTQAACNTDYLKYKQNYLIY